METIVDLCLFTVLILLDMTTIAGDCIAGSKVTNRPFSDTIVNHTLVGPVMSNITAKNERECEMECHLAVPPDKCYMFNYHPSSKVCELLYKDRAAEYKVEKKKGSTFKTRKCASSPCLPSQQCVALGDQDNTVCLKFTGRVIKANTAPVCIGSKDDSYGTFFAPADGKIKTFKLVHISGTLSCYAPASHSFGKWGCIDPKEVPQYRTIQMFITDSDTQRTRITPPPDYPMITEGVVIDPASYSVPGSNSMSHELVFPNISPLLAVTKGKEFRIWFGQDLISLSEANNGGTTCANVYVYCY